MTNYLRISLTFIGLWLLVAVSVQVQAQPIIDDTPAVGTYSLKACIKYAFEHSNSLKKADLDIKSAEARIKETRAIGLPQVNAEANFSNAYIIPKSILPDGTLFGGPPGPIAVEFQPRYSSSVSITATQLLFDGSYFIGLKAARVYRELSQKQAQKSKMDIAANVAKSYYGVLVYKERINAIQQNYLRIDTLLKSTQEMYKNGAAEKIDVDRLTVQHNNIQSEKRKLLYGLNYAAQVLKFQMGMPLRDSLTLVGSLKDFKVTELKPDELLQAQFQNRIEYSILETNKQLYRLDIKNKQAGNYPRLVAFANYGSNFGSSALSDISNISNRWFRNGTFGLTLSIPIFGGFQRKYAIQQSRIDLQKNELDMKDIEKLYNFDVETAQNQIIVSLQDLEKEKKNLALAKEVSRVSSIKFQAGTGTNKDIVDAENEAKQAEANYYNALFSAVIARIDLLKAQGKILSLLKD